MKTKPNIKIICKKCKKPREWKLCSCCLTMSGSETAISGLKAERNIHDFS